MENSLPVGVRERVGNLFADPGDVLSVLPARLA